MYVCVSACQPLKSSFLQVLTRNIFLRFFLPFFSSFSRWGDSPFLMLYAHGVGYREQHSCGRSDGSLQGPCVVNPAVLFTVAVAAVAAAVALVTAITVDVAAVALVTAITVAAVAVLVLLLLLLLLQYEYYHYCYYYCCCCTTRTTTHRQLLILLLLLRCYYYY